MKYENDAMANQSTHLEEHTQGGRLGRNPLPGHLSRTSRRDPYPYLGRYDGPPYLPRLGQVGAGAGKAAASTTGATTAAIPTGWADADSYAVTGGFWLTNLIMQILLAYKWTTAWISACGFLVLWVNGEVHWLLSLIG